MEKSEKSKLLSRVMAESFAMTEAGLFLDSHPTCREALEYFEKHKDSHEEAVREYEEKYGPLTLAHSGGEKRWSWVREPFPWEGEDD